MISHQLFSVSDVSDSKWDEFVRNSDNGTIFHTREFLSYHHKNKFKDASFIIKKGKNLLSVVTAAVVERNGQSVLVSHPGASFGGFIYKPDLNFKEAHSMVEALLELANEQKVERIQLTLPPIIYQTKYSNYIDFALVRNGFDYLKRDVSSIVQLDFEPDELLSTYRSEARTATKKAIKKGVIIKETDSFDDYYKILETNLNLRHNVTPAHTLPELKKLKKMFPDKIRLWGAFLDDKLIAGVCNFSTNKNVVLAFYISHDEEYQEYRAVNLLFYEIMKKYKEEGYLFLDFGIFTVNMEPNWGLGRFKENFGARGIFRDTFIKEI